MASSVNKEERRSEDLSSEYEKHRASFIADLRRFNENRGTPFDRIPEIAGREVDLYHLYQRVIGQGGWQKVNNDQLWEEFQEELYLPKSCVNSAQALKNIYFRYLNLYEKVNFLGEDPDVKSNEEEDGPARKKICLPIETIPLYYNYNQHKLTDAMRQQHNLSMDLYSPSEYEKLLMSLRSGLPNEVDFAMNICMLLSTEGKHCMKLEKCPQLVSLLLAHIGVFDKESDDMQDLYQHSWMPCTNRNFLRFWFETVDKADVKSLITWRGCQYIQRALVGSEVLNLGRDLGVLDVEGQRVLQVAVFLHNLSFEEANQKILASSYVVYKFLMLGLHSTYGGLRQIALDTFANLSCEYELDSMDDQCSQRVLNLLNSALFSEDRFFLVRGLEILSKISQVTSSEASLGEHLKESDYKRLIDLLTVQDIQLIVHTLEALYKLSKIGEPFTSRIARVHKAVDTLVSLITIEAQSFGPGSLVGIKVVEYVPPAHLTSEDGDSLKRPTTVIQPINPDSVNIYQVPTSSQGQGGIIPDTGGGKGPGGGEAPKVVAPPPEKEKETLTDIQATSTNWLNATYELKKKSKVNQVELFSDYLQFCRKFSITNALSSADFLHLVKVTFSQCEVLSINRKNGDKDVYFEGLCKRQAQKPFAVTTLPPERVRNPLCVNVSPKQTLPTVAAPLAHTPTLRQRLMEPPRVPIHPQLPHTGASTSTQTTPKSSKSTAVLNSSKSTPGGLNPKIVRNARVLIGTPTSTKKVVSVINSSGSSSDASAVHQQQVTAQKLQTPVHSSPGFSSGTAQSFPSISHALQAEQKSDTSDLMSVKSLLAKKLSQGVSEPEPSSSPGPSYYSLGAGATTVPSSSVSSGTQTQRLVHISGPAVNFQSSQVTLHQQPRLLAQTPVSSESPTVLPSSSSSSTVISIPPGLKLTQNLTYSDTVNTSPITVSTLQPAQHNTTPLNTFTIGTPVVQGGINNISAQQNSNVSTALMTQQNNLSSAALQNSVVSFVQRNNASSFVPGAHISLMSQNILHSSGSHTGNITVVPQQNSVNVHLMQPSSAAGSTHNSLTFVQQQSNSPLQNSSSGPCAILPKVPAGTALQQSMCQTAAQPPIIMNHSAGNPATVLVSSHNLAGTKLNNSAAMTLPGTSSVQGTIVSQPGSSPSVAALLATSSHSGSQMIISAPVIRGQVQRHQAISGQGASTVVIQTPPGTIVMPSRQVVVQGGGSTFGTVQQGGQAGTVSFIVPNQYRQGSSVTVQGLNFIQQQGSMNMVPSLALGNSTGQSSAQNFIQAAQTQQNLLQTAQTQQNLLQPGTRQIVLAPGQAKTIPVQISSLAGNFMRNNSNVCISVQEPQPQQSIVLQQQSIQSLPQAVLSTPTANITMNICQSQPVHTPLHHTESQSLRSDIHIPSQQPVQQMVNQTLNMSSAVVMDGQQQAVSNQCNGLNHDVNGILGSPESVGSDYPPSPLSVGIVSDKEMSNGRLMDIDKDGLGNKIDIDKIAEKSKMNGYVHLFDGGGHDAVRPSHTEGSNIRCQTTGVGADSSGVVINGCVSGVIQNSNSVGQRVNIPGTASGNCSSFMNSSIVHIQGQPSNDNMLGRQQVIGAAHQKVINYVQQQQPSHQLHLHHMQPQQQQVLSSSHSQQVLSSAHGPQVLSSHGQQVLPSSRGMQVLSSSHDQQVLSSSHGQQVLLNSQGQQVLPSSHGQQVLPSSHGQQVLPSSHVQQVLPSLHGQQVLPSSHGQQVLPSSHGQQVLPSSHGQQVLPSSHGQQVLPSSHGQQVLPSSHGQQVLPSSHGQQVLPSSHGQQVFSSSHSQQVQIGVQAHQMHHHPVQLQRPPHPGAPNSQHFTNIQCRPGQPSIQSRPRLSTLPSPSPGPQSGAPAVRPVLSRDTSRDSDASNDSISSVADMERSPLMVNGQGTQTLLSPSSTSKNARARVKKTESIQIVESTLPRSRTKRRGDEIVISTKVGGPSHKVIQMEYMCEWANCRRCFSSSRLVFLHVFKHHLPKLPEASCQWNACEKLVRKKWSLVSHFQDHHTSESAMRAAFHRRLTSAHQHSTSQAQTPQPMIYPPDAAMQAIRRFSVKQPYSEFAEQREGPVSKHIRLTAALILRNICHFSSLGRRLVKRHEQELSYNMMNTVEASTALANCLFEIVHTVDLTSPAQV